MEAATRKLADQVEAASQRPDDESSQEIIELLKGMLEQQQTASRKNAATMKEMVGLLERGFRIRSDGNE